MRRYSLINGQMEQDNCGDWAVFDKANALRAQLATVKDACEGHGVNFTQWLSVVEENRQTIRDLRACLAVVTKKLDAFRALADELELRATTEELPMEYLTWIVEDWSNRLFELKQAQAGEVKG